MDFRTLIPSADVLPVHWAWFQGLLNVTFVLHLILMNLMLGGMLICFIHQWRGSSSESERFIVGKLPFFIAFTVNFGVAPLLFLQVIYGHFIYTSSVLMACSWLSVIVFLLAGYYGVYIYGIKWESLGRARGFVSGIVACCFLLIAFIFVNNLTMMQVPETWLRYFDNSKGLLLNIKEPTLMPRYLHFILSSTAVAGLALALYGDWQMRRGNEEKKEMRKMGLHWFIGSTLCQVGVGLWFFKTLPPEVRSFTGSLPAWLFSLFLSFSILGTLVSVVLALGRKVRPAAVVVFITIVFMVGVREIVRVQYLAPHFTVSDLQVVPQYSPMLLFLLFFAGGIALVWYMVRLVMRGLEVQS
ncbi:MAG: hypothetical protein KKD73_00245 [Proteobacteria bacterium]|nr:hypothetical protein [Pseudomonadota bacterium]MBU1639110.1 hypothetical protein [Pseudomonadota bacterium]